MILGFQTLNIVLFIPQKNDSPMMKSLLILYGEKNFVHMKPPI